MREEGFRSIAITNPVLFINPGGLRLEKRYSCIYRVLINCWLIRSKHVFLGVSFHSYHPGQVQSGCFQAV